MQTMTCNRSKKLPCCSVTYCPLVLAWASTMHTFQGFEAGFDAHDAINHLLVDPGGIDSEQRWLGMLYVALSRAKTIGLDDEDPSSRICKSSIYWIGSNISRYRLLQGHLKWAKNKKSKVPTEDYINRKEWVSFLNTRANHTSQQVYTADGLETIRKSTYKTATTMAFSPRDLEKMISCIIQHPSENWATNRQNYKVAQIPT